MDVETGKTMKIKYKPWCWPYLLVSRLTRPVPPGLWFVNFIFQRILRINSQYKWPINFTSRVVGRVDIGKNSWISFAVSGGCYIQGGLKVFIGADVVFAPGVKIISANHSLKDVSQQDKRHSPLLIGNRVWIGANAIILPGVRIADDAVIGAGAVVTKDVAAGAVVVGCPAQVIRYKEGYDKP